MWNQRSFWRPALKRMTELTSKNLRKIDLDDDLPIEVRPRPKSQILMARPRIAITASVEASSVGVEAPTEADVGAFVFGENAARLFFENFQRGFRWLAQVLDVGGVPRVGRVGDRLEHEGVTLA